MRIKKESLENFEVKIAISDYPDLCVRFFVLPMHYILDEFQEIKNNLKIQTYFNKKAEKDLLMLELYFFFQKELPPKNPEEMEHLAYPNRWIKRYYSEIKDSFFELLKNINKKKIIDKADVIAENWRQPVSEIIKSIDELEIKNLRREGLSVKGIKESFNKKIKNEIIKILKDFIEEINSPEINIKINEEYPDSLEKRRKFYQELCYRIWKKYYRKIYRKELSQYLFFIKQDAEEVYIKYYLKVVKDFISLIKDQVNDKELKMFKMYYLPLDILGNKILYLCHYKYFNSKDFDKNIAPLLVANKVFGIKKVRGKNIKEVIVRALKAFLAILYSRKILLRQDEKEKKNLQRRKNKIIALDNRI